MAWKLRQSVEGDRIVTVEGVGNETTNCWINNNGTYIPNSIAIKIDAVTYTLSSVASIAFGFLFINLPSNIAIGSSTSVQVFSTCSNDPAFRTMAIVSKPLDVTITTSTITNCAATAEINATVNEYIRLFFDTPAGDYANLVLEDNVTGAITNLDIDDFVYQPGDSGNILSHIPPQYGFYRPSSATERASLFSVQRYHNVKLNIGFINSNYFTVRLGNIELVFNGSGVVNYINYLSTNRTEQYLTTYEVGNQFVIDSTPSEYKIYRNGSELLLTISKIVTYNVDGGYVTPAVGMLGTPSVWTLPNKNGIYTFTVTLSESIRLQKKVTVHSCGSAVDDEFRGAYNTPFYGNVNSNDNLCIGENTYTNLVPNSAEEGIVAMDSNGNFEFVPEEDYSGISSFQYERWCGNSTSGIYELVGIATVYINFENDCSSTIANWQDTGREDCIDCSSQKEQRNLNFLCTGGYEFRWINSENENLCDNEYNWQDTNKYKCELGRRYRRQININRCTKKKERWTDLGPSEECKCEGEIFITTCCGCADYTAVVKLYNDPTEENRAINACLSPEIGESYLKDKRLRFSTLNDGALHDYMILLFDGKGKLIAQIKLEDYNCYGYSISATVNNYFDYTLNFNL